MSGQKTEVRYHDDHSLIVGGNDLPAANIALESLRLRPRRVDQVYFDKEPIDPKSGNVRIGWNARPNMTDPEAKGAVAHRIGEVKKEIERYQQIAA